MTLLFIILIGGCLYGIKNYEKFIDVMILSKLINIIEGALNIYIEVG